MTPAMHDPFFPRSSQRKCALSPRRLSRGDCLVMGDGTTIELLRVGYQSTTSLIVPAIIWSSAPNLTATVKMICLRSLVGKVKSHIDAKLEYQVIHDDKKQQNLRVGDLVRGSILGKPGRGITGELLQLEHSPLGQAKSCTFLIWGSSVSPQVVQSSEELINRDNSVSSLLRPRERGGRPAKELHALCALAKC